MVNAPRNWRENADDLGAIEKEKRRSLRTRIFLTGAVCAVAGASIGYFINDKFNYSQNSEQVSLDSIKHLDLFDDVEFGGRDLDGVVGPEPTFRNNEWNYEIVDDNGWPINLRYTIGEDGKVNYKARE